MNEVETFDVRQPNTVKLFFKIVNNEVASIVIGNHAVSTERGYQFYVKNHVAEQIDKCELYLEGLAPKLRVKEGETIFVPELSERDREIERLKYELEVLQNDAGHNKGK